MSDDLVAALREAAKGFPYRGVYHDKGFREEPWTDEAIAIVTHRLNGAGVHLVTEATLAHAILVGAREDDRRPTNDGFEWYGSADDMAAGIIAALRSES